MSLTGPTVKTIGDTTTQRTTTGVEREHQEHSDDDFRPGPTPDARPAPEFGDDDRHEGRDRRHERGERSAH